MSTKYRGAFYDTSITAPRPDSDAIVNTKNILIMLFSPIERYVRVLLKKMH
jgi:hypothetical protein